MKTTSKLKMISLLLVLVFSIPMAANTNNPITTTAISAAPSEDAKTEVLLNRLNEIKDMDKSNLTRADKKALRSEVKAIKKSMKASSRGIYLSIGAVIIIILLLILIL
ncbi:hypothetical protein [Flavobacterium sp. N1994]|uniref:hypothetical protein n=1 Tax=Flavobacterium sp. N1994 TaxID=2986827 RepID=UPI002222F098|nr:hypothetical protein [Flavobacterium sp. N1994]